MLKKRIVILCLILSLVLTGCSLPQTPDVAADGTPWGDDWTNVGAVLGVEPLEGWTSQRSEDLLADVGMYFAAWTWGEGETDSEGSKHYPAQIFLVLSGCADDAAAQAQLSQWQALAAETYRTEAPQTLEHTLGTFTVIPYRTAGEDASFDLGLSALAVIGAFAVNVEISCREDAGLDPEAVLTDFLNACHFAA